MTNTDKEDVIGWNGAAWLAGLCIVGGVAGIVFGMYGVIHTGLLHLITVILGASFIVTGIGRARTVARRRTYKPDRHD